jgi:dihydrofolate reductase
MLNRISLDGYFASKNEKTGGMEWFVQDPAVDKAVHEPIHADTLLLGAKTFALFERTWVPLLEDPNAPQEMKALAQELTDMKKLVFSEKLTMSEWQNTQFFAGNLTSVVGKLKQEEGTDILVLGSGTIVQQLAKEGLIDEYLFIMSPVVVGNGRPLFDRVTLQHLKLLKTTSFDSGNVVLHYVRSDDDSQPQDPH